MDENFVKEIKNNCKKNSIKFNNKKIVLGLSGGLDSVGLLLFFCEIKKLENIQIVAVHINHSIREEAKTDEQFVESLCKKYRVKLICRKIDIPAKSKEIGRSLEETGRIYRRRVFEDVFENEKADYIVLAHHANDRTETILHNVLRGSGLKGIEGIKMVEKNYVRPFINVTKKDIGEFVRLKDESYVEDKTNLDNVYTRNYIRNIIIPSLEFVNAKAIKHINMLGDMAKEANEYIQLQTKKFLENRENLYQNKNKELVVNVGKVLEEHSYLQKEIVRAILERIYGNLVDISNRNINDLIEIMKNGTGKNVNLPQNIIAKRQYDALVFCENENKVKEDNKNIGNIKIEIIEHINNSLIKEFKDENTYIKYFDYDIIKGNLELRNRKNGDFISLIKGHKIKIKDYFINEKVPREKRDEMPLVSIEGTNEIIWIVGMRMSQKYQIRDLTERVLKVTYYAK